MRGEGLKIAQFTLNKHYNASGVNASRTYQAALTTEHTFVHFEVCSLVLSTPYQGVYLAEIKLREIACGACCSTRTTTYAGLQFGHFVYNLVALAQVVVVDVDNSWLIYRKTEIYHTLALC